MLSSNESKRVLMVALLLPLLLLLLNALNRNPKVIPPSGALSGLSIVTSAPHVPLLASQKRKLVEKYISDILQIHDALSSLPNFRPSAAVNEAFERLVSISVKITEESITDAILSDPRISSILGELQHFSSEGEGKLESHWANEIISAGRIEDGTSALFPKVLRAAKEPRAHQANLYKTVTETLSKFPYYDNYVELTKMELSAIRLVSEDKQPQSFAFLGSGPLPLTSLCIINQLTRNNQSVSILNVDHSLDANRVALHLSRSLNYPNSSMSFLHSKAETIHVSLDEYDVVYVAALVGSNSREKSEIFSAVLARMRPGALLVIRTAHSLRQLLYPAVRVETDLDPNLFEPLMVVHPYCNIINSVIVGRVKERQSKLIGSSLWGGFGM